MITKTINLHEDYQSLFEEIKAASKGTLEINNIEQFFGNIKEIADLNEKFLRLPLDEPIFEIDANTRKITIPDNFKTNGLSVQGDNLAETVFFCIDRYFDHTDLNTMDIRIKWKIGQTSGESANFIQSVDIKPGYIIFGWPIVKDLTGKSGVVNFAVEFYNASGYSLNTLVHSVNIKEGLLLDNPVLVDVNSLILGMLRNSEFGDGEFAVADITWLTNGLVEDYISNTYPKDGILNLPVEIKDNVPTTTPVDLYANGTAGLDATVMYDAPLGVAFSVSNKYLPYEGSELEENEIYYIKVAEGVYEKASSDDLNNFKDETNPTVLYKNYAVITADQANTYYVVAQGVKYDQQDIIRGRGAESDSLPIIVPTAKQPLSIDIVKMGEDDLSDGSGYTRDNGIDQKIIFIDDNGVSLQATPKFENGFGALRYIWYKDNEVIEEGDWTFDTVSELDVAGEGEYKLSVVNYRNATYAEPAESEVYTASYLASTLTAEVSGGLDNGYITLGKNLDGGFKATARGNLTIEYEIANSDRSTQVRFALMNSENKEVNATFADAIDENKEIIPNTKICTINSQYLTDGGEYYISVSNVYNGSIYTTKATIGDGDKFIVNLVD